MGSTNTPPLSFPDVNLNEIVVRRFAHTLSTTPTDLVIQVGVKDQEANPFKEIKTHRIRLQLRSEELATLVPPPGNDVVSLPTVNSSAFESFHAFLCTNEFATNPPLPDKVVVAILKLGLKYIPDEMEPVSAKLMQNRLKFSNVFMFRLDSEVVKLSVVYRLTTNFIEGVNANPKVYLDSADFLQLEETHVAEMFSSDSLQRSEIEIFKALVRWAKHKPGGSGAPLRGKLKNLIYHIRFPIMRADQFEEKVDGTGVMSEEEEKQLFKFFTAKASRKSQIDIGQFINRPRVPPVIQVEDEEELGEQGVQVSDGDYDTEYDSRAARFAKGGICQVLTPSQLPKESNKIRQVRTPTEKTMLILENHLAVVPQVKTESESGSGDDSDLSCTVVSCGDNLSNSSNDPEEYSSEDERDFGTTVSDNNWKQFLQKIKEQPSNATSINGVVKLERTLKSRLIPILMKNLKKVVVDVEIVRLTDAGIMELREYFDPVPYIFYENDASKDKHMPQAFFASRVDFQLIINGCIFLKLSRIDEEIVIGFGGPSSTLFINQLEENTVQNFTKLILVDSVISDMLSISRARFEEITLWGIYRYFKTSGHAHLSQFLQGCTNLRTLVCWAKGPPIKKGTDMVSIDLQKDLISGNLGKMSLHRALLVVHPFAEIDTFRKEHLTELYTNYCHFTPRILRDFKHIFPNLEKVSFGAGNTLTFNQEYIPMQAEQEGVDDASPSSAKRVRRTSTTPKKEMITLTTFINTRLLLDLTQMPRMKWIRIVNLNWTSALQSENKDFLQRFLLGNLALLTKIPTKSAPENVKGTILLLPTDLLLQKEVGLGQWRTRIFKGPLDDDYNYNEYAERRDLQDYDTFKLDKIFRTLEDFKKYNKEI